MTKEEYIRFLIRERDYTVKGFAKTIDMPYTTLLGMLKNGLGGAAVDNVIKICRALDITVEDLLRVEGNDGASTPFWLSEREKRIIISYRSKPQMHPAIDAILDLGEYKPK